MTREKGMITLPSVTAFCVFCLYHEKYSVSLQLACGAFPNTVAAASAACCGMLPSLLQRNLPSLLQHYIPFRRSGLCIQ